VVIFSMRREPNARVEVGVDVGAVVRQAIEPTYDARFGAVLAAFDRPGPGSDATSLSLDDARESLAYWEARGRSLPRHAIGKRREARAVAARWHQRVAAAERETYGRGLVGALLIVATERRLPESTCHAGRVVAHRARQAAIVVVAVVLTLLLATALLAAELVRVLLGAL
jgi:hypothetical protein